VIAVDTNVLLRLIVRDDERQFAQAQRMFAADEIYLLPTVVLETEWVLRSRYRYPRAAIADALLAIFALPRVAVERDGQIRWALDRYRTRGGFADLVHLACVPHGVSAFATFDGDVAKDAGSAPPVAILDVARH
jgi:predicted nucleic-acid-binding protein